MPPPWNGYLQEILCQRGNSLNNRKVWIFSHFIPFNSKNSVAAATKGRKYYYNFKALNRLGVVVEEHLVFHLTCI